MNEIPYIGPNTTSSTPPLIDDSNITPAPNTPINYSPNPFGQLNNAISHTTITLLTSGTVPANKSRIMQLHQNTNAKSAIIILEAAPGADKEAVLARFWMDGMYPTNSEGLPLKHMGVFEIQGYNNVKNFRIISADDKDHVLQVQYIQ